MSEKHFTISICDGKWEEKYISLRDFVIDFRRFPSSEENEKLNEWIAEQKYNYNNLPQDFISLLNCIPGWKWEFTQLEVWHKHYNNLCQFIKEHKRVPNSKEKEGIWVIRQRHEYNIGILSQHRIEKLDNIDIWEWKSNANNWETRFNQVLHFIEIHNRLPHKSDKILYEWCMHQKALYKRGVLSSYRIKALESIPLWLWYIPDWEKTYEDLKKYVREYKKIPCFMDIRPINLNNYKDRILPCWIYTQKEKYKKGSLYEYKSKKLMSLPNWKWEKQHRTWDIYFNIIKEFSKQFKHIPDDRFNAISVWCSKQRRLFNRNLLPKEQIEKLNTIPKWYWK